MDVYDTIYSVLVANDGRVDGRTAIQKLVYLSCQKIRELDVPPYEAHYYGPFSPGLAWALAKMVSYSFLYEASISGSMYEGYTYGLTDDGREIAKKAKKKHGDEFGKVAEIVRTCRDFCGLKATPLSYASKIHYLLCSQETKGGMSPSDAVAYARELGWNVSKDNVEQGAQLLERLELAKMP